MKKLTWNEFEKKMTAAAKEDKRITGVIVYSKDNWDEEYSLESRSYEVFSDANYFHSGRISTSLPGYALDGSDDGTRLDCYKWKIDYCYIK